MMHICVSEVVRLARCKFSQVVLLVSGSGGSSVAIDEANVSVLALNPWGGGSHRAFLDGWMEHSRHQFTVLSLPPCHWKWRMRHSALTFAHQLQERVSSGEPARRWDVIFATDMVNIAELRGLLPPSLRSVPIVLYFHENQLTYPVRVAAARDLHFAYTNFLSAIAADHVWFNSAFHRDSFTAALRSLLRRMPDSKHSEDVDRILTKSCVQWPGASVPSLGTSSLQSGLTHVGGSNRLDKPQPARDLPIRVVWASRWEHDKNPELFFAAVSVLRQRGVEFRLSVLGESFSDTPECFSLSLIHI